MVRSLAILALLATGSVTAETQTVKVTTEPVTLDYKGAKLCFSSMVQAAAYYTALNNPKWVNGDAVSYLKVLTAGRDVFGRIMVLEGQKSGKSRADVATDLAREKESILSYLHSGKPSNDYAIVLAQQNEQARDCLAFI